MEEHTPTVLVLDVPPNSGRVAMFDFLGIPLELQYQILSYLEIQDIPNIQLVSRYFYALSLENGVWRSLAEKRWPGCTAFAGKPAKRRKFIGLASIKWKDYFTERVSIEKPGKNLAQSL